MGYLAIFYNLWLSGDFYGERNYSLFSSMIDVSGIAGDSSSKEISSGLNFFSITAVSVLLIACMNFMNLSTARSANRAKEVGMRKVIGARRSDIIRQFFSESVLLSLLAFCLALGIAYLMVPTLNMFSGKRLGLDILGKNPVFFGIVTIACFTGLVSGGYPALFLSSFLPIKAISVTIVPKKTSHFSTSGR